MSRFIISLFLLILLSCPVCSQQRQAAGPALLQLTGLTTGSTEVTAQSQELLILYEPGRAKGELQLATLSSSDNSLNENISKLSEKTLLFDITIPEGKFAFGNSMEEVFEARGNVNVDDITTEFNITFKVSNLKTSDENIFQVLGQGRLSLKDNFRLSDTLGLQDSFTFLFTQNIRTFTP